MKETSCGSLIHIDLFFPPGYRPQESKGTLLRIQVTTEESKNPNEWHAQLVQHDYAVLSIAVTPSAEAIIGKYQLYVDTLTVNPDGSKYQYRHEFEDDICVLFNPWCSGESFLNNLNLRHPSGLKRADWNFFFMIF